MPQDLPIKTLIYFNKSPIFGIANIKKTDIWTLLETVKEMDGNHSKA